MLEIIIPVYNSHNNIIQTLSSIYAQNNYNQVKVTLVDNASDDTYDYLLKKFKSIDLSIIRLENPIRKTYAQQIGLENATGDYLMFLQSGDSLYLYNTIDVFCDTINNGNYDIIYSNYIKETDIGELEICEDDIINSYAKIYKKSFIDANNIKFINENVADKSFSSIICSLKCDYIKLDSVTCLHKQTNNFSHESNLKELIINTNFFINEIKKRNINIENTMSIILYYFLGLYALYNDLCINIENNHVIKQYTSQIKGIINSIPEELLEMLTIDLISKNIYSHDIVYSMIKNNNLFKYTVFDFIEKTTP